MPADITKSATSAQHHGSDLLDYGAGPVPSPAHDRNQAQHVRSKQHAKLAWQFDMTAREDGEDDDNDDNGLYQDGEDDVIEDEDDDEDDGRSDGHSDNASDRDLPDREDDSSKGQGASHKRLLFLDLPVDILRLVVQEMSNISDLTCLARACWTLYTIAIPQLYSRFDIVWPDSIGPPDDSRGVDALTYGLSTLCLGSSFAHRARRVLERYCTASSPLLPSLQTTPGLATHVDQLRDSDYAQFTRKFALSNGPEELLTEYMINKESGKMLGTLVAMALRRMVNLESFVWDMPTGVLSEVFMSLASLRDHQPDRSCNLKSVWIRWHRNSAIYGQIPNQSDADAEIDQAQAVYTPPTGAIWTPVGHLMPEDAAAAAAAAAPPTGPAVSYAPFHNSRVEFPTFSVLPPVQSLTVLEVDELAYLDEMAILISESRHVLTELRVGMADRTRSAPWFHPWDGDGLHQINRSARWPGDGSLTDRRRGGVLGVLMGHIYDIQRNAFLPLPPTTTTTTTTQDLKVTASDAYESPTASNSSSAVAPGPLRLKVLELEGVSLSVRVGIRALDWSVLTSITLLRCPLGHLLWKSLRLQFSPVSTTASTKNSRRPASNCYYYPLSLTKIYTDEPCPDLLVFVGDVLRPNSLDTFFLHEGRTQLKTAITMQAIFKHVVRRHKSSLHRLLLCSSSSDRPPAEAVVADRRFREWVLSRDMLLYMTSGRMVELRELSIALDYANWHTLLQRLPNMPRLRSLHIHNIIDAPQPKVDAKELAQQVVDIVSVQPHVPLCYVAIMSRCFELMETPRGTDAGREDDDEDANADANSDEDDDSEDALAGEVDHMGEEDPVFNADVGDDEESAEEDGDNDDDDDDDNDDDDDYDDDDDGSTCSSGADSFAAPPQFRLREILFYDDKIEIFKARHAQLKA